MHFETPAQVGSENRPRLRGLDHAVAPVRPHHSNDSEEEVGGAQGAVEAAAALVVVDVYGAAGAEDGVGVGGTAPGAGSGIGGSTRERPRSNGRPEPVDDAVGRAREEDSDLPPEGAVAVEAPAMANPAHHHQENGIHTETK